ncbi:hypothetical protein C1645_731841 [Glomus cerebriforme]|uniref:Uncharacterized protein n=1 Tax=Glomus cerebriforme TaxID=658196 RepID=A0A397TIY0_9GLOM|nr:hypothetical protein C1645_731841 [Glomus cerebriforme]
MKPIVNEEDAGKVKIILPVMFRSPTIVTKYKELVTAVDSTGYWKTINIDQYCPNNRTCLQSKPKRRWIKKKQLMRDIINWEKSEKKRVERKKYLKHKTKRSELILAIVNKKIKLKIYTIRKELNG